jgi:hypothetical protein
MKKTSEAEDDLRPEYDLHSLRVVARGPGRRNRSAELVVQLEPDVAEAFPNAAAVNEALRFLIRLTQKGLTHQRSS